jgi:hypothetical protein
MKMCLASLFAFASLGSCKPVSQTVVASASKQPQEQHSEKWSLLKPILAKQGRLLVFIEPNTPENAAEVSRTVGTWSTALQSIPEWPVHRDIEVVPVQNWQEADIMFAYFSSIADLKKRYPNSTGSALIFEESRRNKPLIVVDREELAGVVAQGFPEISILVHEFGHALGLGDTYEMEGYQTGIGRHRRSVMRGGVGARYGEFSSTPTEDDVAGLSAKLAEIRTGRFVCPKGYVEQGVLKDNSEKAFSFSDAESRRFCVLEVDKDVRGNPESLSRP